MIIRFFNNSKYNLEAKFLYKGIKHRLMALSKDDYDNVESIELNDETLNVTMHEDDDGLAKCITQRLDRGVRVKGKIRWFNESSGEGVIRLENGISVPFYSCNVVGADSGYPHLVSNVQFTEGQDVVATIPADLHMFESLGLIKIKAA